MNGTGAAARLVGAVTFTVGALAFYLFTLLPANVDVDGTLQEPFFLLPVGFFLMAVGFLVALFGIALGLKKPG